MTKQHNRRTFIEFLGKGTVGAALLPSFLQSCNPKTTSTLQKVREVLKISPLAPSAEDELMLASGFKYDVIIRWEDKISENDTFGFNNDFTCFVPFDEKNPDDGILWVNHEYVNPLFVSNYTGEGEKTKEQVSKEMYNVGGSLLRVKKDEYGKWNVVKNDKYNRRITGHTKIKFNWHKEIAGSDHAIGTLANCSGGITPWGTILTCEENYDGCFGERNWETGERIPSKYVGWEKQYDYPPEHYGWVVEVNPKTGEAQKHIALGRCAHECATMHQLEDGRLVVYTGDDANDECLYKFIGSEAGSLREGTLYVANVEEGRWESLNILKRSELQGKFKDQTEVLIRLREASKMVGGSLLDRPEDIEIDPMNGSVLVSLTNNVPKGNYHGSILKLVETDGKHDSLTFTAETYLAGGEETGFTCPDNMAFDTAGNLWFTSDISGSKMNKAEQYMTFKNNSLFVVPRTGEQAGQVIRVANAPTDAELTGPYFSPDGKTLFLSVQHPGEYSTSLRPEGLTSHWPNGGGTIPRSAVVAITGEGLSKIQGLL